DRLVVDGAEGHFAASRAMALVLRASWFGLSSCNRMKEMAALSISIGRWQPRDLSRKATAMVEEEKGSSNVGCGCATTSWLRVAWSQQGCDCNRSKTRQRCARLLRRRTAAIRSERPLVLVFNLLLAAIKTVGSEILRRLRCRQITAKDHC
ncbi:hypothetical protein BHM03_00056799, partial [Ensete ventricosum]